MFTGNFIFLTLFWFIIGTAVGSFVNVLIFRSRRGENWVKGRSRCDYCRRPLPWYRNVPLLAFLVQRGQTACCGKKLSISHPVVELLTGLLFVWWYWFGFFFFHLSQQPFQLLQPLFWLAVGVILLIVVVVDYSWLIIPDWCVAALLGLTLTYRLALTATDIMKPTDLVASLLAAAGSVCFFGGLWLLTQGRGLGFGDVKLSLPLALLVGWPKVLVAFFGSFVIGSVVGLALLVVGKAKLGRPIPFGPFLIAGTLVALVWGEQLLVWYLSFL